jgi:hypothetical protein
MRIAASILVAAGGNLNWKEKVFVSFAWFPKATVQVSFMSNIHIRQDSTQVSNSPSE